MALHEGTDTGAASMTTDERSRYDQFLMRGAAVNCGIGVAIGLMGGVWDGIGVVLFGAFGLLCATALLTAFGGWLVDGTARRAGDGLLGNGGRDRD